MGKRLLLITLAMIFVTALISGCGAATPTEEASSEETTLPTADLEAIREKIDAGDYAGVPQALEAIIAQDEEDAEAHFLLGLAYFNVNNYEKAREAFERTLALDPQRAAAVHHNLGALAYQTGDLQTAVDEFNAALTADPDDPDSHYQLGATYLIMALPANSLTPDQSMVVKAQEEFEKALELSPGKPEALVGMGNVHLLQNQVEEAISFLEEAVEQNPEMPEALFALGRTYAASGDVENAKATLQRFLESNPPEVWAQQAQEILTQLGE